MYGKGICFGGIGPSINLTSGIVVTGGVTRGVRMRLLPPFVSSSGIGNAPWK